MAQLMSGIDWSVIVAPKDSHTRANVPLVDRTDKLGFLFKSLPQLVFLVLAEIGCNDLRLV